MSANQVSTGVQVREAREKLGLSQKEFAQRIQVSAPLISLVESGKVPVSKKLAAKVAATQEPQAEVTAAPAQATATAQG